MVLKRFLETDAGTLNSLQSPQEFWTQWVHLHALQCSESGYDQDIKVSWLCVLHALGICYVQHSESNWDTVASKHLRISDSRVWHTRWIANQNQESFMTDYSKIMLYLSFMTRRKTKYCSLIGSIKSVCDCVHGWLPARQD